MTDNFKDKVERLLDEPSEPPVAAAPPDRLRARLAATLSEGLGEAQAGTSDPAAGNAALVAAFVDGRLSGAAREKFAGVLARDPALRADVEAASDLVHSIADSPARVPKHLLARANAQFAPEPPRLAEARSRWSFSFADLLPRQRMALAMVAVLAVALAVPAGMMINSRLGGGGGEPELSGVSDADIEAARLKACEEQQKNAAKAGKPAPAPPPTDAASKGHAPIDPCAPPEPKRDGALKK
jgi:hypothetical protein